MIKLEVTEDGVKLGKWEHKDIRPIATKKFIAQMKMENEWYVRPATGEAYSKALNKFFTEKVGCTPSAMVKVVNQVMYKEHVLPYEKYLPYVSGYSVVNGWEEKCKALKLIKESLPHVEQAYKDGLTNILPLVATANKSPQELKTIFSKKGWKSLSKNKVSRNKLIANNSWFVINEEVKDAERYRDMLPTIPSTLLKYQMSLSFLLYASSHFKGSWNKGEFLSTQHNLIYDLKRMAERYEQPFNWNWSPRRMKEEHDRLTVIQKEEQRRQQAHLLGEFPFASLNLPRVEHEGYVAQYIPTGEALMDEGDAMEHCVGGYAQSCHDKNYIVYSVTKDGERSSTIGFNVRDWEKDKGIYVYVSQHYKKYNQSVFDVAETEIANLVLLALKKFFKEQQ